MSALPLLHQALVADADLVAIVDDRVFEHVPARARMPYIVLGEAVARPWDTASDRGRREDVTVHVWSRSSRRDEAERAARSIEAALRFDRLVPLAAAGGTMRLVNVVRGETRTERLPERDLVHTTLRFRLTREEQT